MAALFEDRYCPERLRTQLDNGTRTAAADCNVECTGMCIEKMTVYTPSATRLRQIAVWPAGGTAITLSIKCFGHYGIAHRRFYGASTATLRGLLNDGYTVVLYVDYGDLNKFAPQYSGATFTGTHAIALCGWWRNRRTGKRRVWVYDPLHDGRRRGIPKGPIRADFKPWRIAAEGFAGEGRFSGYAVREPQHSDGV